jgi:hypothetical protein
MDGFDLGSGLASGRDSSLPSSRKITPWPRSPCLVSIRSHLFVVAGA